MSKKDEMIILLAKEGSESAFRELYESHYQKIYRLAYRYVKSPQDAEDIMQEAFIKAFKHINRFDFSISSNFSSWICQIGIHCSIDHLRKRKRKKVDQMESLSNLPNEPEAQDSSPEKKVIVSQSLARVKKALYFLSPKQRIVFDLRHLQHLAIKEIAEYLGCSQSTVKKQLKRAVLRLRKQLEPLWGKQ